VSEDLGFRLADRRMFNQSRETYLNLMAQHASVSCSRSQLYPHEYGDNSTGMIRFKDVEQEDLRKLWDEMRQSLKGSA
jgi:hypothetical protein